MPVTNLSNQINTRVRGRGRGTLPNSDSPYDREEEHCVSPERVHQMLRIHRAEANENEEKKWLII